MAKPKCECYDDERWEKKGYEVNCISKARIEVSFRNTVGVTHTCHDNEEYLFEVNFCPVCGKKMKKV